MFGPPAPASQLGIGVDRRPHARALPDTGRRARRPRGRELELDPRAQDPRPAPAGAAQRAVRGVLVSRGGAYMLWRGFYGEVGTHLDHAGLLFPDRRAHRVRPGLSRRSARDAAQPVRDRQPARAAPRQPRQRHVHSRDALQSQPAQRVSDGPRVERRGGEAISPDAADRSDVCRGARPPRAAARAERQARGRSQGARDRVACADAGSRRRVLRALVRRARRPRAQAAGLGLGAHPARRSRSFPTRKRRSSSRASSR